MHDTHANAIHSHFSFFGEFLEEGLAHLLEHFGLSEAFSHFTAHTVSDFLNVALLLLIVVAAVGYLQTYVPYDSMRAKLKRLKGFGGFLLAIALGVLSPFCSCSVIPVLMGFLATGVPLSFCIAFLSSASALNITALSAILTTLPPWFAATYIVCAIAAAVISALTVSALGGERDVRMDRLLAEHHHEHHESTQTGRLRKAICSAWLTFSRVWPYLLIGVALSAALTVFVPAELIENMLGTSAAALPIATLIGGALHADAFSILPITGTLLSFSAPVALTFLLSSMLF